MINIPKNVSILFISFFTAILIFACSIDENKPVTPSHIKAIPGDFQATIIWDGVPGASYYNLYYSINKKITKENAIKISNVNSPYIHRNLSNKIYYYVVTSVNEKGESFASHQVYVDFLNPGRWNSMKWNQRIWGNK